MLIKNMNNDDSKTFGHEWDLNVGSQN